MVSFARDLGWRSSWFLASVSQRLVMGRSPELRRAVGCRAPSAIAENKDGFVRRRWLGLSASVDETRGFVPSANVRASTTLQSSVVVIGEHGMQLERLRSNKCVELTPGYAPCRSANSSMAGAVHAQR